MLTLSNLVYPVNTLFIKLLTLPLATKAVTKFILINLINYNYQIH